jgi:uncharacterized protein
MELQSESRSLTDWEIVFENEIKSMASTIDPAHDSLHLKRVVKTAKAISENENADLNIVVPAAWLHDFVVIPKNSPLRKQASRISATRAIEFLERIGYPRHYHAPIAHCIEAHSFSAAIPTETLEACVVQDADRLDALGAIGLARCFITSGQMQTAIYAEIDPLCKVRPADDSEFTIDHFYVKLFKIAESLKTESAKTEGARRVDVMKNYLADLAKEI